MYQFCLFYYLCIYGTSTRTRVFILLKRKQNIFFWGKAAGRNVCFRGFGGTGKGAHFPPILQTRVGVKRRCNVVLLLRSSPAFSGNTIFYVITRISLVDNGRITMVTSSY